MESHGVLTDRFCQPKVFNRTGQNYLKLCVGPCSKLYHWGVSGVKQPF